MSTGVNVKNEYTNKNNKMLTIDSVHISNNYEGSGKMNEVKGTSSQTTASE